MRISLQYISIEIPRGSSGRISETLIRCNTMTYNSIRSTGPIDVFGI